MDALLATVPTLQLDEKCRLMDNLVRIILQNAWRSPLRLLFLVISTISLSLFSFQFLVSLDDIFSKNLASIYFQVPVHMCVVNVYFLQNLLPHLFLCDPVFLLYFACLSSWPVRMWVHLLFLFTIFDFAIICSNYWCWISVRPPDVLYDLFVAPYCLCECHESICSL